MAEPLTPEQMAEEHLAQQREAEARRYAQQYLTSQNVPGYSAPAEAPPAPPPPPPPTPPGQPSTTGQSIKKGLVQGGAQVLGGILGGPVGYSAAKALTTDKPEILRSPSETYGPPLELKSQPEPVAKTEGEDPLILQGQGGGQMVSPAGMYPHSNTTQVHQGRDVPQEAKRAFNAATGYATEGAEKQAEAERAYGAAVFNQTATRLRATEDAMAQHQRVQAERDQMVRTKLAEIEAFNAQAAAEIDPNKYWHDRGALAATLGIIGVGLGEAAKAYGVQGNAALQQIEAGMNREIETQWKNRQLAGQKAQHAQSLLGAHLDRLKDQDKAIDATKLALWDNIAAHVDSAAAQRGIDMADANLLNIKAGIAEKRGELLNKMALQETDDVNKQATETWHDAKYAGGGGLNLKGLEPTDTITIPPFSGQGDAKRVTVKNPAVAGELHKVAYITGEIHRINREAVKLLGQLDKVDTTDFAQRREINKKLAGLAEEKSALGSVKVQQGVLKEAEYWRALTNTVGFSGEAASLQGMSSGERARIQRFLRHQDAQAYRQLTGAVQSAGGSEVKHKFVRKPDGSLEKIQLETGKTFEPDPIPPEGDKIK